MLFSSPARAHPSLVKAVLQNVPRPPKALVFKYVGFQEPKAELQNVLYFLTAKCDFCGSSLGGKSQTLYIFTSDELSSIQASVGITFAGSLSSKGLLKTEQTFLSMFLTIHMGISAYESITSLIDQNVHSTNFL